MTKETCRIDLLASTLLIVAFVGVSMLFATDGHAQKAPTHYYRVQLKHGGQFLDASYCGTKVALNSGSTFENGACQLWRLVDAGNRWNRVALKHWGEYL